MILWQIRKVSRRVSSEEQRLLDALRHEKNTARQAELAAEYARVRGRNDKLAAAHDKYVREQKAKHGRKKRPPKQANTVNPTTLKYAFKDATVSKHSFATAFAPIITVYTFLKDAEIIDEKSMVHAVSGMLPDIIWAAIGLVSAGWWLIIFAFTATKHYRKEFK